MPVTRNLIGNQLGSKVQELFKLIEQTPNWEMFVSDQTEHVVKTLYKHKNMTDSLEELGMKYTTARAHLLRAIERITEHKVDFLRKGESKQAQQLFSLMDSIPCWENIVTEREAMLAKKFRKVKSFYELGRELNQSPGNIAATLYGSTQKMGVVGKLLKRLPK